MTPDPTSTPPLLASLPEFRFGRCAQTGQDDEMGDVYIAPAFLIGRTKTTPVVSLHVVHKRGSVELSVEDARAAIDALQESLAWIDAHAEWVKQKQEGPTRV